MFEVAGRVYFEATAQGPGYHSFVTNGFFDKEGYVEPLVESTVGYALKEGMVYLLTLGLLFVFCLYKCYSKRKRRQEENAKLAAHQKR